MALAIDIINGIAKSLEQLGAQNAFNQADTHKLTESLEHLDSSIRECIDGFQETKRIPHIGLARFLNHCKAIKRLLGDGLDKNTTNTLRNVLVNAQMFDKDLETSLENFKPKLLNVLVFGPPIHSLFSSNRAIRKLQDAMSRLDKAAEKIRLAT